MYTGQKPLSYTHKHIHTNTALTVRVSGCDAVFHFSIRPRVFISGPQCADSRPRLALCDLERALEGSWELWGHIVHIYHIHQHLKHRGANK